MEEADHANQAEVGAWMTTCQHTECPTGYMEWHLWAEKKGETHYQVRCPGCGLFAIWKKK